MKTLFLENTYSVNLSTCFTIEEPELQEDWLCICLYYENIISLMSPSRSFNQKIIIFLEHPIHELVKENYTGRPIVDIVEINLNAIRICIENNYDFLLNFQESDREEYINFSAKYLPNSINLLRNSFLKFDLIKYFVVKNIPSLSSTLNEELQIDLIDFKQSLLGKAFVDGIDEITKKYNKYYYITNELEELLKTQFIKSQQKLLDKLDIESLKKFKLLPFVEDSVGMLSGLIIPFLPLGVLKELFLYIKTRFDLKDIEYLEFMLSIYSIQKILTKALEKEHEKDIKHCYICQITEAEIKNIDKEHVHNFIFSNSDSMCQKHLMAYLMARKFGRLTGHSLLLALKQEG